jgi:hypothetical protein
MYGFIFGFQRRVWWPKWTPASRSAFMEMTDAIGFWAFLVSRRSSPLPPAKLKPSHPSSVPGEVGF